MKNIKKNIIINKIKNINILKNKIKYITNLYFIQNNSLTESSKSLNRLILNNINLKNKKKLCLFTSRKRSINKNYNISRQVFRKLASKGILNNVNIN